MQSDEHATEVVCCCHKLLFLSYQVYYFLYLHYHVASFTSKQVLATSVQFYCHYTSTYISNK